MPARKPFCFAYLPWLPSLAPTFLAILAPWTTSCAIALFGFHIFDPAPAARQAVLVQMHTGVVVFDACWRIISLNTAAEATLGITDLVIFACRQIRHGRAGG